MILDSAPGNGGRVPVSSPEGFPTRFQRHSPRGTQGGRIVEVGNTAAAAEMPTPEQPAEARRARMQAAYGSLLAEQPSVALGLVEESAANAAPIRP